MALQAVCDDTTGADRVKVNVVVAAASSMSSDGIVADKQILEQNLKSNVKTREVRPRLIPRFLYSFASMTVAAHP